MSNRKSAVHAARQVPLQIKGHVGESGSPQLCDQTDPCRIGQQPPKISRRHLDAGRVAVVAHPAALDPETRQGRLGRRHLGQSGLVDGNPVGNPRGQARLGRPVPGLQPHRPRQGTN
ncbi:MAG: hypothetical protein DRH76_07765, partial [Deltaproteobacteria bacterium]